MEYPKIHPKYYFHDFCQIYIFEQDNWKITKFVFRMNFGILYKNPKIHPEFSYLFRILYILKVYLNESDMRSVSDLNLVFDARSNKKWF